MIGFKTRAMPSSQTNADLVDEVNAELAAV